MGQRRAGVDPSGGEEPVGKRWKQRRRWWWVAIGVGGGVVGDLRGWYNGVRVGEAANPGPYEVGGASGSGRQAPESAGVSSVSEVSADWWDTHGTSVRESWAMLHAGEVT